MKPARTPAQINCTISLFVQNGEILASSFLACLHGLWPASSGLETKFSHHLDLTLGLNNFSVKTN